MTKIIALFPEQENLVPYVLDYIDKNKDDIEEIVTLVRLKNDPQKGIYLVHSDPSFEIKCAMLKLLDYQINAEIMSEEADEDEES